MKKNIFAIILAGGSGERFWPLSSPERPKQFLKIFGGKSLIRQAMERILPIIPIENVLVVTAKSLEKATVKELPELPRENVILEPCRKNTAPAIATALGEVLRRGGPDALAATLTADQLMEKPGAFRSLLRKAYGIAAKKDVIVTLGVQPTYPATGFGYINAEKKVFVEKPDAATAARYVKSGKYVWNAGMFIFRAGALHALCGQLAPELVALADAVAAADSANAVLKKIYPTLTSVAFDYAIMERTRAFEVVSGDFGWDDVGGYAALAAHLPVDGEGNVRLGKTRQLDCSGCTLLGDGVRVSAFGLKDIVIASCGDEVLVMPRSRAADLKRLLEVLPADFVRMISQ